MIITRTFDLSDTTNISSEFEVFFAFSQAHLKNTILVSRQAHATISNALSSPIYRTAKRALKTSQKSCKNASKIADFCVPKKALTVVKNAV